MQEIKVQCDCGQKYKFDVEPVNGRMPFRVNCPICGVDGTAKANELLMASGAATAPAAPAIPVAVMARPMAVAAAPMAVATAAPPAPPQLRINRAAAPPALTAEPSTGVATMAAPGPIAPISSRALPGRTAPGAAPSGGKPNFGLGLAGGLAGAAVGGIVYFLICYFIGFHLRIVGRLLAIGVGYLAGLGAELLGRKEGSKELGALSAIFALAFICAAQYCNARVWWNHGHGDDNPNPRTAFQAVVAEAKKAVAAVPTGSDAEIRAYLAAADAADSGEKPDLAAVTDDAIKEFRETTLPEMRKLASGQTTSQDFEKKSQAETAQSDSSLGEKSAFMIYLLAISINKSNILGLIGAAATAFKVASNA